MQYIRLSIFILLITIFTNSYANADDNTEKMKVDFVYDGDTFFANGNRVRIWGIQTPEFKTRRYFRAGAILEEMIVGKEIDCLLKDIDRHDRKVMQCWKNGEDISLLMIKSGEAKEYLRFTKGYYKNKSIK